MPSRPGILAGALLLLAAGAAAEPGGYDRFDGVTYYFAYGAVGSASLALGPGPDAPLGVFDGCVFAQLRPDLDHGRIRVLGLADNATSLEIDLGEFRAGEPAMQGGIATNLTVDGSLESGSPPYPPVPAQVAAWGTARIFVGEGNFTDPLGSGPDLAASFLVTDAGYRDDGSGAFRADGTAKPGDWEAHLRIGSPPGAVAEATSFSFAPAGDLPDGTVASDPQHAAFYPFANSRFGGTATARLTASSPTPPGSTELRVRILDPTGRAVANATLAPSVLGAADETLVFPLDRFGDYGVEVQGALLLGQYGVEMTLEPPAGFALDLWWEEVALGAEARDGFAGCQDTLGSPNGAVSAATAVGRRDPPSFLLELVVVGVVAAAATLLLVVKFAADTLSSAAFRKVSRK